MRTRSSLITSIGVLAAGLWLAVGTVHPRDKQPAGESPRDRDRIRARLGAEFSPEAMRRAVKDLTASYPDGFRLPEKFDENLADYQNRLPRIRQALDGASPGQIRDACRAGLR